MSEQRGSHHAPGSLKNPGRRRFLRISAAASPLVLMPPSLTTDVLAAETGGAQAGAGPFGNPTFTAFVDTVLPGSGSDPSRAPGALEAGTIGYIAEMDRSRLLPVSLVLVQWAVCRAIDTMAFFRHGKSFRRLGLPERTRIVADMSKIKGAPLLLALIRAPFYTGTVNRVGFDYLGYPGPNEGYADFSFNEETWRPDPRTQAGNLP